MPLLQAHCVCGNFQIHLKLTKSPQDYAPRACDCDFCIQRNAAYVSDPHGALELKMKNPDLAEYLRQGSNQAEFLQCRGCQNLIAVIYRSADSSVFGAVNASLIPNTFGESVVVSPKKLSPQDKNQRWQEVWFPNIKL